MNAQQFAGLKKAVVKPQIKRVVRRKNGFISRLVVPERAIQAHILAYLQTEGFLVWRNNSGLIRVGRNLIKLGPTGSPDIIGMTKTGRWLGIECKTEKGKQTEQQLKFQHWVESNNGIYILARSVSDVIQQLKDLDRHE